MDELAFLSATVLAGRLASGELSSRELLEHYLRRIERYDASLRAVVTVDAERARAEADAADARLAAEGPLGPLHGLPMTVKDQFATAGMRTTFGARELADAVPGADAVPVDRLRRAGAVVFGKTNLPRYGIDVQTSNRVFGTTSNPWDTSRTPGGSSGGSAAALAAGFTALELGADLAGSIRIPAHYCGVYGHKPTYGLVPDPPSPTAPPGMRTELDIAAPGPMARSAGDLDLALDILAGPHGLDAKGWRLELPPPRRGTLREYRVAAWLDDPACPTDPEVLAVLEQTVAALRRAGVTVDEAARPGFDLAAAFRDYQRLLYGTLANMLPFARLLAPGRIVIPGDGPLARVCRFGSARHGEWLLANEAREEIRRLWGRFFADHDVLLCPASPVAAIAHDHRYGSAIVLRTMRHSDGRRRPYVDQMVWPGVVGMAYLPATVAPVGTTSSGLPVGIQIVGAHLDDRTTIDVARHLADVVGSFEPPPRYADAAASGDRPRARRSLRRRQS